MGMAGGASSDAPTLSGSLVQSGEERGRREALRELVRTKHRLAPTYELFGWLHNLRMVSL